MTLLRSADPTPAYVDNPRGAAPLVLVCEHAGRLIPAALGDLGLPAGAIDTHIGWDIGALAVARTLAARLDAPLVVQRYSRLVVDCNRPPEAADAVPESSWGVPVPANRGLDGVRRAARVDALFRPYDALLAQTLSRPGLRAALSIHSFTPTTPAGEPRPWHVGLLNRRSGTTLRALKTALATALREQPPAADETPGVIGLNEPYTIDDASDWFVPMYAERLALDHHCLIEIRNDLIDDERGAARWGERLATALALILELQ